MVAGWLKRYMHACDHKAAEQIADWFADYEAFRSHGRRVGRENARSVNVKIVDLEDNPDFQDAVLSVHHATMHTFAATPTAKIIENHHGRAWIHRDSAGFPMPIAVPVPAVPVLPPDSTEEDPPKILPRAERRRREREQRNKLR